MTLTLALDTATDLASVALGDEHGLKGEVLLAGRRHSAALAPAVGHLLELSGADWKDVRRIVVANGPGSFTGLRIGFATVQGIVRGRDGITVATAPSLMAAAWVVARVVDGPVAALYDALRGQVFGAIYRFHADRVEVLIPPTLTTVAELRDGCPATPLIAVGDGAEAHAAEVVQWTGRAPVGSPAGGPRAHALVGLASVPGVLRDIDPFNFEPDYGRPAEAQARWEAKHGKPLPPSAGHAR